MDGILSFYKRSIFDLVSTFFYHYNWNKLWKGGFQMNLKNLSEEEKNLIYSADPFQMTQSILNSNLRGLEKISIESIKSMNLLPVEVVNVLLVYFYSEYAGQVYNRNDLKRLYHLWASAGIRTYEDALEMTERDIHSELGYRP
jgi:replication initiation and membrane attachment protein DnaB